MTAVVVTGSAAPEAMGAEVVAEAAVERDRRVRRL